MPFERDPLSVLYDSFSHEFLSLLRSDLYGWHTATVRSLVTDPVDARGLSSHERAVKRSLYYVLNGGGFGWVKNEAESLVVQWGAPKTVFTGSALNRRLRRGPRERHRILRAQLTSGQLAYRHVPDDGYVFNPDEQAQNLRL